MRIFAGEKLLSAFQLLGKAEFRHGKSRRKALVIAIRTSSPPHCAITVRTRQMGVDRQLLHLPGEMTAKKFRKILIKSLTHNYMSGACARARSHISRIVTAAMASTTGTARGNTQGS